jgi:hypothetical protein
MASYLPNPKECINKCGAMIYFDVNNPTSRPSADKWVPLTYVEDTGVYTGEPHDCPKRAKYGGNGSSGQQQQQKQEQQPTMADILVQIKLLHQKLDKPLEEQSKR